VKLLFGIVACLLTSCTRPSAITLQRTQQVLTIEAPALYPETIVYDEQRQAFLVSSLRRGAIYQVDRDGRARTVVEDPRLCSVLGFAVDRRAGRLWVVNSDLGASVRPSAVGSKQLAAVGVYDLATGKALRYLDLSSLAPGPHLLNGIALDAQGNAYVTDSFTPVIYRIDASGAVSVFLRAAAFAGDGINLNGVVVHPNGYLLVVKKSDGSLFKVPLLEPARFSRVLNSSALRGGDGVVLLSEESLVIVANRTPQTATNAAMVLTSGDDWDTARLGSKVEFGDVYPTTAALRDGSLYVVYSKLNALIQSTPEEQRLLEQRATIERLSLGR